MRGSTIVGGPVDADPSVATAAAERYLAAVGHSGTVAVHSDRVEVSVSFGYRTVILGAAGLSDITVTGTATARAERGVTQDEAP
jgi:predicted transcriptional regulator